jgi:hypothetical protein
MSERVGSGGFKLIRRLVANGCYDYSQKVEDAMNEGRFDLEDLEHCIATGKVVKTNRDELKASVGNKVYVIIGRDTRGRRFYAAGKILRSPKQGLIFFFVTAYPAR